MLAVATEEGRVGVWAPEFHHRANRTCTGCAGQRLSHIHSNIISACKYCLVNQAGVHNRSV